MAEQSRSSFAAARRTRAELVSDQADYLVVLHCSYRWLRHRRDRVRSAKSRQGMGLETGRARTGVQRKPCWHSVWFGIVWLGRRPLRPQGGAGLVEPALRRFHAWPRPIRPISIRCSGCVCLRALVSAALSPTSSPSTPNPRRANCVPPLRLSLLAVYRSAAPFLASSPRRLYRNMAGKSCFMIGGIVPIVIALVAQIGHAGIDQIHGAARKPARQDGAFDHCHQSRIPGAAKRQIRHRGRTAVPGLQSGVSLSPGTCADHAAALVAVCAQPDGLFLPAQLDADADDRGQAAADDGGACRRDVAGRRHGRGAAALLVAATAPFPRHRHHVRDCRTGRRFDRFCGLDLARPRC